MSERQKKESSHKETALNITIVDRIIQIYIVNKESTNAYRDFSLELEIIEKGRK